MKILFLLLFFSAVSAAAEDDFPPPDAYPLDHFDVIWKKNPFTLKTAPAAIQKETFAKDFALGSMVQFEDNMTVVVVNTKTRERIRLVNGEVAPNGMRIKSASLGKSRRDSFVTIERDGEVAVLRYDESFQKQLAGVKPGSEGAKNPAAQKTASTISPSSTGAASSKASSRTLTAAGETSAIRRRNFVPAKTK